MQIQWNPVIKRNTVIDQISLRLESGNVTGFKGINGSGKTMLMRLIAGLIKTMAGEVVIDRLQLGKDMLLSIFERRATQRFGCGGDAVGDFFGGAGVVVTAVRGKHDDVF